MINMVAIWITAVIIAAATSGCILKDKQFTITDKKTGIEVTVSEDDLNIGVGGELQVGDLVIKAEEKKAP